VELWKLGNQLKNNRWKDAWSCRYFWDYNNKFCFIDRKKYCWSVYRY